jgi:hypothetical protein
MSRNVRSVLAIATILAAPSLALGQTSGKPVYQQASLVTSSRLQGLVRDEKGHAVGGAMISALAIGNGITGMQLSDANGRFQLPLPPGTYVVRANRAGYTSCRDQVLLPASRSLEYNITMTRQPGADADRPVMLAGAGGSATARPPAGAAAPKADASDADHPHDELAWRLRQLTRTALRDTAPVDVPDGRAQGFKPKSSLFDWVFVGSARAATSFLTNTPFTGQLNFLTSSMLAPAVGASPSALPRGIAYAVVGAPVGNRGDWTMRGSMNSGDGSSWAVLGEYQARAASTHAFRVGASYSLQSFTGGDPESLSSASGATRSAGGLYGFDRWRVTRGLELDYGVRLDRFDYVQRSELLSPRLGTRVAVLPGTYVIAFASQRMVAPGAEEFLPPVTGPWLPPERMFDPLGSNGFIAERVRRYELGLEHQFGSRALAVRHFHETSANQLVNLFALNGAPDFAALPGRYYVGSAGGVDVDGWDVRASGTLIGRLKGRVDYSVAHAHWLLDGDAALLALLAPSVAGRDLSRIHDLTTALEANVPETATRVSLVYRMNSAFSHTAAGQTSPGLGGRFDLQINQALPFQPIRGSRMELLFAMRSLFRDLREPGSMYDELLTVAPPMRVIGGLQIHF